MLVKGHSKHIVAIICLVLLSLACSVSADARQTISKVLITNSADKVQIVMNASSAITINMEKVSGHLVFDIPGHLASNQTKQVKVNSGDIGIVKCGWYKADPPTVRIAVSISSKRPYTTTYSKDKKQVTILVAKRGHEAKLTAKSEPAPKAQKPVEPVVAVEGEQQVIGSDAAAADKPAEPASQKAKPVLIASAKPVAVHSTVVNAAPVVAAGNRVSLDFVGTDIHDVLKALSLQSNTNIVASPDVKGEVTVSLNNVTVDDALKLVTNLSGFKFQEIDGTYVVGTPGNFESLASGAAPPEAGANRVAEVAMVRHSDPGILSKMLAAQFKGMDVSNTPLDDKKGVPNGASILVLSGTADQVKAAQGLVAQVENSLAANAAATEMEMYEVKYADINELAGVLAAFVPGLRVTIGPNQGFNLESPDALSMGDASSGGGASTDTASKKVVAPPKVLLLQGSAAEIARARDLLARVDVQQPQIVIEAKVIDIRNDSAKDLGIEWSWSDVKFDEFQTDSSGQLSEIMLGRFQRSPIAIVGKLKALVESGKARVLANPSVSALDGKPASIFIGDEFKYVINIQQTPTGVNVTTETARVGVQLHAISRVSSDGFITMDLHPEVSVITNFVDLPAVGLSLPEISRRYVDSTVRVKDGETIVVGGLIREQDIESMSGIPILSNLPIIGGLFKTRSRSKAHSEILMFITPRILTTGP